MRVPAKLPDRWLTPAGEDRPTCRRRLSTLLNEAEVARVEALYHRRFLNQVLPWRSRTVYLTARRQI